MPRKKIKDDTLQMNICTCGVEALENTFTWADLGGRLVLLCWECTDKLHKKFMAEDTLHEV